MVKNIEKNTMKKTIILLAIGLLAVGSTANADVGSHGHIRHILMKWKDTPNNTGLLPTARAEAEIAAKHAGAAAKKLADLAWMKKHTKHVIHAVNPEQIAKGPGQGYGVLKAAKAVVKHIMLTSNSADASDNIRKHAVHISASGNNTVKRAEEIIVHANKALEATSASDAAPHVKMMSDLARQLIDGKDANGDGKVSWHEGEGGLAVAEKHMAAMAKAEGI